ncbi:unnamed protein product [Paramecium sonneborni]|uniref:Uncharacterized protein n=1 Tax=Paramecium sonneborni TaxID=65129 RepID=A0A8S1RFP8_9CILI|nr:unnamed protein product [Paramecium sonneborni]
MNNILEYLETRDQEIGVIQVICLQPLIIEYFNVNYDLTCAISNIINQNTDICIFKIQKQQQNNNQNQEKTQWDYYRDNKIIATISNKEEILQKHLQGFKEQLFIKFSIFDENDKPNYLDRCQKTINYIQMKQKDIMFSKQDTLYLAEEVKEHCQQWLTSI